MPFDPSHIKPPQIDPDKFPGATRDDKVTALARKLYARGLASTMADAKRLADGMVETERKVVKQMSPEPVKPLRAADAPRDAPTPRQSTTKLDLPDSFAAFVENVAKLPVDAPAAQPVKASSSPSPSRLPSSSSSPSPSPSSARPAYVSPASAPVSYGREEARPVAAVPHAQRTSQKFFDDAPDLTKLRGYTGPKRNPVEYTHEKMQELRRPVPPAMPAQPSSTPVPSSSIESSVTEVVRVSTGDAGVKVTKVDLAPQASVVEETMVIDGAAIDIPTIQTAATAPKATAPISVAAPSVSAQERVFGEVVPEDVPEDLPEKTVELPKSDKPRVQEDLAKKHGVDLFEMFKKKG